MENPVSRTSGMVGKDQIFMARVVSADGTGTAVTNEGNAVKIADISTCTCTVYDYNNAARTVPVAQPTVTIATAFLNVLTVLNNWGRLDTIGCNFSFSVPGANFAAVEHTYRVVFEATTAGGAALGWYHEHTTTAKVPS